MPQKTDYHWDAQKKEWLAARAFELRTNRKLKEKAILRLQKEIAEIDQALQAMSEE